MDRRHESRSRNPLAFAPGLECDYELVRTAAGLRVHSWVLRDGVKQYDNWCPASELATERAWLAVAVTGGLF